MRIALLLLLLGLSAAGPARPARGEGLFGDEPAPAPNPQPAPAAEPEPAPTADEPAALDAPAGIPYDPAGVRASKPSPPLEVKTPPGIRIWSAKAISMAPKTARFEVERWVARGSWARLSFQVGKGDRIGGLKRPPGIASKPVDCTTRWKLADIKKEIVSRDVPVMEAEYDKDGVKTGMKQVGVQTLTEERVLLALQALDEEGNPLLDPDGNPLIQKVPSEGNSPLALPDLAAGTPKSP